VKEAGEAGRESMRTLGVEEVSFAALLSVINKNLIIQPD
jgi:hypothetical protein